MNGPSGTPLMRPSARRAAGRARRLLPAAPHRRPPARGPPRREPRGGVERLPAVRRLRAAPAAGRIPPRRTDAGAFLIADAYGARRTICVKDVEGAFTADPHGAGSAGSELRDNVTASELLRAGTSLPIDRVVLELMGHAKHITGIQIVNGLTPGALTRAPHGEPVGTVVHAS